jgi:hypothetical protein
MIRVMPPQPLTRRSRACSEFRMLPDCAQRLKISYVRDKTKQTDDSRAPQPTAHFPYLEHPNCGILYSVHPRFSASHTWQYCLKTHQTTYHWYCKTACTFFCCCCCCWLLNDAVNIETCLWFCMGVKLRL